MNDLGPGRVGLLRIGTQQFVLSFGHEKTAGGGRCV